MCSSSSKAVLAVEQTHPYPDDALCSLVVKLLSSILSHILDFEHSTKDVQSSCHYSSTCKKRKYVSRTNQCRNGTEVDGKNSR
jgi:hypothetical protein